MTKETSTVRRRRRLPLEYRDSIWGYTFIMPMFIGFLIVTIAPVIATFVLSLTNKNMMSKTTDFIGMVYYIYQMGFTNYKFGYASAASLVLFLMIVALTLLQWSLRKRWVYHED